MVCMFGETPIIDYIKLYIDRYINIKLFNLYTK